MPEKNEQAKGGQTPNGQEEMNSGAVKEQTPEKEGRAKQAERKKQPKGGDINVQLSALEEKLEKSEEGEAKMKDALMRTAAEYENYRKRSQKEIEASFSNGVAHAVLEMLEILDVLEAAADAPTQDEEYKKGVHMTLAKCHEVFRRLGVEEIQCFGGPFDPELHNAVMQEECKGVESGNVSRVVKKGYINKDGKVVRHAMVCVAP